MKLKATRRHERYSLTLDIDLAHGRGLSSNVGAGGIYFVTDQPHSPGAPIRSEEHTSELQSRLHLVCRLLLEKKKKRKKDITVKRLKTTVCRDHDRHMISTDASETR